MHLDKQSDIFYKKISKKNFIPTKICEIGVYKPETSKVLLFIYEKIDTTLVEADKEIVKILNKTFENYPNVKIINSAIYDRRGKVELYKASASTFISELPSSPAIINDDFYGNSGQKFVVDSVLFSDIDDGDYDLISIDIEGADWFVLKYMKSQPKIISIETHGKYYKNPYIVPILEWMKQNNYITWIIDNSDTVFVKKGEIKVTLIEKIILQVKKIKNLLKSKKRYLKIFLLKNNRIN
jgi:FkbM family methyltransferase